MIQHWIIPAILKQNLYSQQSLNEDEEVHSKVRLKKERDPEFTEQMLHER